ncbi:early nodulin-55-1-like [Lotus japonicus]|uniref:early nodulin-55-1-like n=1 Tax=Lotus japonicus TaxID=34305 RepID=UPI002586D54D|nr:early nodulin-55-1-like [Lotus japonicus]
MVIACITKQVSQSEYEHCTSLEPVKVFHSSPVIIPLKEKGVYFFTCSILNYCCLGQKIIISVHENSPQNPPTPSPPISQVPSISPQSSPPPLGMSNPPSNMPNGTDGGNSPVPASTHEGEKSNAVALMCRTSFMRGLSSLLATFLGFWVV